MMRSRCGLGLVVLGLGLAMAGGALATTVLELQIEDMIPLAPVVVVGEVNQIESSYNSDKTQIHTRVWISPSEVLKGPADLGTVLVKTIGGQVGDKIARLPGAPRFELGERVLVFLEPRQDGEGYLTTGFFQGKFKVFADPKTGRELLLRDVPGRGVSVVGKTGDPLAEPLRSLDDVRALFAGGAR